MFLSPNLGRDGSTTRTNTKHQIVDHLVRESFAYDVRFRDAQSQIWTPLLARCRLVFLVSVSSNWVLRGALLVLDLGNRRSPGFTMHAPTVDSVICFWTASSR